MIHTYMYLAFRDLSILFLKVSAVACNATLFHTRNVSLGGLWCYRHIDCPVQI